MCAKLLWIEDMIRKCQKNIEGVKATVIPANFYFADCIYKKVYLRNVPVTQKVTK